MIDLRLQITSSSKICKYSAQNYTELLNMPIAPVLNDLTYVYDSEGTAWLPGTLGGSYYPAGIYVYDGTDWISDRSALADQIHNAIHTDIANEFNSIVEKTTVHGDDWLIIEDSEDSGNKKKVKAATLKTYINI